MPTRLTELRCSIDLADSRYHTYGESSVPDHTYDAWKTELRSIYPADPRLSRVGAPVAREDMGREATHDFFMGSIANSNTFDNEPDVNKRSYINGFTAWAANRGNPEVVVETKADGLSLNLVYVEGTLVKAITRGDGTTGVNVTANAMLVRDVPSVLDSPFTGSVRGEVVMPWEDWKVVDPQAESDPRAKAAGTLRRDDGANAEHLAFRAFSCVPANPAINAGLTTEWFLLSFLEDLGFVVVDAAIMPASEVAAYHEAAGLKRSSQPIMIDGTVVKINNRELASSKPDSNGCPWGQVALKWPAEEKLTTLTAVEWNTGHTGKLAPRAFLEPVRLGGKLVRTATLCNADEIDRLKVAVGDQVAVYLAGDTIIKVARAIPHTGENRHQIEPPVCCLTCGGPVQKRKNVDGEDSVDIYCINVNCPAQARGKIERWISSLGIKEIGEQVLTAMMETVNPATSRKLIVGIADLYRLVGSRTVLADMHVNGRRYGEKRTETMLHEIEKTRVLTISQFIGSLGITFMGKRRAEMIRRAAATELSGTTNPLDFPSNWFTRAADKFSILTTYSLALRIPGIAQAIQKDLDCRAEEINDILNMIEIQNKDKEEPPVPTSGPMLGQVVVITGEMSKPREEIQADIVAAGGKIGSGITGKTTLLVQADPTSKTTKSKKASALGIKIVDEAGLLLMLNPESAGSVMSDAGVSINE